MNALQDRARDSIARQIGACQTAGMLVDYWGQPQTLRDVAEGIVWVTSASHGGIVLSPERNAKVPEYLRKFGGVYEEDCDWCIPFLVFTSEFRAFEGEDYLRHLGYARETLRGWHEEEAARFLRPIASAMDARAIAHTITEDLDRREGSEPAVRYVVEVQGGWDVLKQKPSIRYGNVILVSQGKEECA